MLTMEQDGVRTDERVRIAGWLARLEPTRPASRIVLRTLLVADAGLLLATGTLFALFMERPAGFVFAGCCWALAALLMSASSIAHRLARRRDQEVKPPSALARLGDDV